jgi:hypothetical protein
MDSSKDSKFKQIIKKPAFLFGSILIVVIILLITLLGGGEGGDPTARDLKNLSNQHESTLALIDKYSREVRSAKLKANLSQVSIILTADKNDIEGYYAANFKDVKDVKASVSAKPEKELLDALDDAAILNNLDSSLKIAVAEELKALEVAMNKVRRENLEEKDLVSLMDKLILNTQTMSFRLNEGL